VAKGWRLNSGYDNEIIWCELAKVIDPEMGLSVVDLGLVDEIDIRKEEISVNFHLRTPDYPTALALFIAGDIKERLVSVPGIRRAVVTLNNHVMAVQINRQINDMI